VTIGNTMSSLKNIENGVPQGLVMSVMAMANICEKIEEPTKILGYANTLNGWMAELQRLTYKLVKLARETGLTISAEKTKTLLVHRRRPRVLLRPSLKIWMGERMLEMVRHHRILSLILDKKLNWKEQLKNVKARASKKLNLLKTLAHKSGGNRRHC
jgi:putative SOS response-associated peptidase YedK